MTKTQPAAGRTPKRKRRGKPVEKTQNIGIRIAGTLLAYYRTRRNLSQLTLAERMHVSPDELRNCEQGDQSTDFVNRNIGLIADILHPTGQELLQLQSAARADDFLHDIRLTRETEQTYQHKAKMFQSLLLLPEGEARRWLRVVFAANQLRDEFAGDGTFDSPKAHTLRKIEAVLDRPLVTPEMLVKIRKAIREACNFARSKDTELEKISQMLLYRARSVAVLPADDFDRQDAVRTLRETVAEAHEAAVDHVVRRHLAHGLCELGAEDAMCSYLAKTDTNKVDARKNLEFLLQRSADAGDGLKGIECVLKFIEWDRKKRSVPLCTLDLRTAAQLIARQVDDAKHCSTALQNIRATTALAAEVTEFLTQRQPEWFSEHLCNPKGETCQQLADRYAGEIIAAIRAFSAALPEFARDIGSRIESI
jgi:transcriptional regulator with XRE-family HTH domain